MVFDKSFVFEFMSVALIFQIEKKVTNKN